MCSELAIVSPARLRWSPTFFCAFHSISPSSPVFETPLLYPPPFFSVFFGFFFFFGVFFFLRVLCFVFRFFFLFFFLPSHHLPGDVEGPVDPSPAFSPVFAPLVASFFLVPPCTWSLFQLPFCWAALPLTVSFSPLARFSVAIFCLLRFSCLYGCYRVRSLRPRFTWRSSPP